MLRASLSGTSGRLYCSEPQPIVTLHTADMLTKPLLTKIAHMMHITQVGVFALEIQLHMLILAVCSAYIPLSFTAC